MDFVKANANWEYAFATHEELAKLKHAGWVPAYPDYIHYSERVVVKRRKQEATARVQD